ncbi:MAG: ATP-dependent DNA helicase UvrD2, partial [Actinobacteria bacterium]|nr:ATP-dependent DNA helicase UvrD2 [Actinomycetota bacterium]
SVHGPVVVLAGAGTGKTRAITHRMAYAVATGAHEARRSLAVTFTTRAAGEMRVRLRELGVEGAQVRTFHGAALRQLRYFWPRLSGQTFPDVLPSKARLLAEAASKSGIATNAAVIRDLASDIEWSKVSELAARDLLTDPRAATRQWSMDLADVMKIYAAYDELKSARALLDFEDVLLVTVGALQTRPDILDEVHSAYRWFTVDEFQDVNPLQHRLLTLWRGDRDEVCAVGDVSQTIYSFTGASADYLVNFRTEFPDATEVRLVNCYRCTPEIVSKANAVIVQAHSRAAVTLRSMREPGVEPTVQSYPDEVAEATAVAESISTHLRNGISARDIAVLFRMNAQSADLEAALSARGIAVVMRGAERFFDRPEVREGVTRIRGAARAGGATGVLGDEVRGILSAAGWAAERPQGSGAVRERWESLAALVTLADENPQWDLPAFVTELDHRSEAQHAPAADAVTLSSLHSAKGLEWQVVFIVGCSDGLLPLSNADSPDEIEEERRLLYVGMTRAKSYLHLSWARARQPGGRENREFSKFLVTLRDSTGQIADGLEGDQSRGSVQRGSGRARTERKKRGPAMCRTCGKGLVTAPERSLGRCRTCPSTYDPEQFEQLKRWRLRQATEREVPAFVVFTDATLLAIVEQLPASLEQLAAIPGIGPAKLELYGPTLLELLGDPTR